MLKMALITSALFLVTSSFAEVERIEVSKTDGLLSRVEKVVTVQKGDMAVRLVQLDNGGSTDISSAMSPSRLYLTVFQQGEMYDTEASYEVLSGMRSFKVIYNDLKSGIVDIEVVQIKEETDLDKPGTYFYRLTVLEAMKAVDSGKVKGSSVGIQDITPRE